MAPPCLACRCDVGVPAPSCCWFPHAVQSHHGHLVPSSQSSPHCRHIKGFPSHRAAGCCAPGRQSCLPAACGAPGLSLPFTPAPSIIPHRPTQRLSRPCSLSGEQREDFLLSVFCTLSLLEDALHSDWDKNQGEKELFLRGMRAMGSDVSFLPARLSRRGLAETLLPLFHLSSPFLLYLLPVACKGTSVCCSCHQY